MGDFQISGKVASTPTENTIGVWVGRNRSNQSPNQRQRHSGELQVLKLTRRCPAQAGQDWHFNCQLSQNLELIVVQAMPNKSQTSLTKVRKQDDDVSSEGS